MELIGLAVVFVLIVGVVLLTVRGLFARDLTQALKRVANQEQELQAKAEILEQRLSQLEKDHQLKLKQAEAEAQRLVQEAKQQAMNIRTAAIEEAKHRARQLVMEAEQLRGHLKQELRQELNGRALARVCEAIQTLLSSEEQARLHNRLVAQLLEELARVEVAHVGGPIHHVQVTAAHPLSAEQTKALRDHLLKHLGPSVGCEVKTDATLVAGCVVQLGDLMLDGSLKHYLRPRDANG